MDGILPVPYDDPRWGLGQPRMVLARLISRELLPLSENVLARGMQAPKALSKGSEITSFAARMNETSSARVARLDGPHFIQDPLIKQHGVELVQTFKQLELNPNWQRAVGLGNEKVRLPLLDDAVGTLCAKVGMPRCTVVFDDVAIGSYGPGTGKFSVDSTMFLVGKQQLARTSGHELTHFEQDVLMIRRWADKIGIGKTASDAELGALQKTYFGRFQASGDERFFASVAEHRAGQSLSAEQATRADALIRWHQYQYPAAMATRHLKVEQKILTQAKIGMDRGAQTGEMVEFLAKSRAASEPHRLVGLERIENASKGVDREKAIEILQQGIKRSGEKLDQIELRAYWQNLGEREARGVEGMIGKLF